MSRVAPSQVFGWTAIIAGTLSLISAKMGDPEPTLTVSLLAWGILFLLIGSAILLIRKLF